MDAQQEAPQEVHRMKVGSAGFIIIMPGTWAHIPLDDEKSMTRAVTALVKRQVGTNDRLASRRRQFRDELLASAKDAAESGAISFSLALELMRGIPFSGAMLARELEWPPLSAGDSPTERLTSGFPSAQLIETEVGPIARVATKGLQTYTTSSTTSLDIEYWVPDPSGSLLGLFVSLPMVPPELDPFVELFDAIVGSLTWETVRSSV